MTKLSLHTYQKNAYNFCLKNRRSYLAIDMGLGKTVIALKVIQTIRQPTLIVAPLNVIYNTWPSEIKKWGFDLTYTILHGKNKKVDLSKSVNLYLINFEGVAWLYQEMYKMAKANSPLPFSTLVVDEASRLKSHKTKLFKYLNGLQPVFQNRFFLSGTPSPQGLSDLWSQYYLLTDGRALNTSFYAFRNKYYEKHPFNPFEFTLKTGSETEIYEKVKPYTYRLDAKDHLDMPPIIFNYVKVELPKKLMAQYMEFYREFLLDIEGITCTAVNAAALSSKLRQFLQGFLYYDTEELKSNGRPVRAVTEIHSAKIDALKQLIESVGQPVLVAIQFKHELEMIRRVYPDAPIIAGQTNVKDTQMYVEQWNRREIPLLLCHPQSISHGMNLQAGGNIITYLCTPWSLEQYQQFNGRLHRQGQKQGVVVNHIIVEKTIDTKVTRKLAEKGMTQQKLLDFLRDSSTPGK